MASHPQRPLPIGRRLAAAAAMRRGLEAVVAACRRNAAAATMRRNVAGACVAVLLGLAGCEPASDRADWANVRDVTPPFLAGLTGGLPSIAADTRGRVALTWVTSDSIGRNLWLSVSRDSGFNFGPPLRVNLRPSNVWSDLETRPLPAFGPAGQLAIAWSEVRDSTGAVDLVVRASGDAGGMLGMPVVVSPPTATSIVSAPPRPRRGRRPPPRLPAPPAFQGFPALTFLPDGSLFVAWLESRDVGSLSTSTVTTLRSSLSRDGGQSWARAVTITDSACGRCRPSARSDAAGRIAVAYRGAAGDFRDPALAVSTDRGASFPLDTVVSADRWQLPACPADGPALAWNDASGGALAWYSGASPRGVFLLPWHPDHGAAGIKRPIQDGVAGARRPCLSAGGTATWLAVEARPIEDTTRAVLAVRLVERDGTMTPWATLGAGIASGWIAALDERTAVACWSEDHDGAPRLRIARLRRR